MAKTVGRKPPSRIRYEKAHPTVSCRLPRELYDRLCAVKKADSRSFADILKIGLGTLEVRAKEEGEVRKQAYAVGYQRGYAEAERIYKVTYACNVCGKMLAVTTTNEKEAIRQYMQDHRWAHGECHKKRK